MIQLNYQSIIANLKKIVSLEGKLKFIHFVQQKNAMKNIKKEPDWLLLKFAFNYQRESSLQIPD